MEEQSVFDLLLPFLQIHDLFPVGRQKEAGNHRLELHFHIGDVLIAIRPSSIYLANNFIVKLGVKKLAEDLLFIIGFGTQQLHEFALCNHGDLHELLFGQADQLPQFRIRFLKRVDASVR